MWVIEKADNLQTSLYLSFLLYHVAEVNTQNLPGSIDAIRMTQLLSLCLIQQIRISYTTTAVLLKLH